VVSAAVPSRPRFSRLGSLFFLSSSSSFTLAGLSGPRSVTATSQYLVAPGIETGTPWTAARNSES
jgi:hypothetical protein